MRNNRPSKLLFVLVLFAAGCAREENMPVELDVPHGYMQVIQLEAGGRHLEFGPFAGYYFKPRAGRDFKTLSFLCFNERQFYSSDAPENAMLFKGTARLSRLPPADYTIPRKERINPVFFEEAPDAWLRSRPKPAGEFLHFHSCYSRAGAVRTGYWLRHVALTNFTYDMGGRVDRDSPLFHRARRGLDTTFAKIIEFDNGPQ
jgi:hypothetical protein